jgi:iron(III) transport system substrate-binding protein
MALVAITSLIVSGCGGNAPTTESAELPTSQEELIALAKEEGSVVIGAGGHTRPHADLLAAEFNKKYGIPVEVIRESSGEIAQKVQAQLSSRSLDFDVVSLNDSSTFAVWDDEGVLAESTEDVTSAPVLGPLKSSENSTYVPFTWYALGFAYNEARTDADQVPRTWDDLASRDGTFAIADPGSSGAGLIFVKSMELIQPGYFERYVDKSTLVSSSALALSQLLATGEADYGLPGIESDVLTARAAGEPLAMAYPEGRIGALPAYTAPLAQAKHPAAARLLMQFQLSEEFQQLQVDAGYRSTLEGLPAPAGTENIAPDRMVIADAQQLLNDRDSLISTFRQQIGS